MMKLSDLVKKAENENVKLDTKSACFALGFLAGQEARKQQEEMNQKKPICVTGGTGFLGSWIVKMLYDKGYIVHCTTRSAKKANYIKSLCPNQDKLKIFTGCDLLKDGTFDDAIKGCDVVIHTASPFFTQGGTMENLVKPALEGTSNVLNSCTRFGVKRVVLTSSTAAVYAGHGKWDKDHVYNEDDWSPEDRMIEWKNWYCLSKTRAEKCAWNKAKSLDCTFRLAVMNPTLIWGPMLKDQPHFNTSCAALVGYMDGTKSEIENGTKAIVDVRDVAEAHVLAALDFSFRLSCWGQRTLLIGACSKWIDIVNEMKTVAPKDSKIPSKVSSTCGKQSLGAPPPYPTLYDGTRAVKLLGRPLRGMSEMTCAAVKSMIENGFVKSSQYEAGA